MTIVAETTLRLTEKYGAVKNFSVSTVAADGTVSPYDLTGAICRIIAKKNLAADQEATVDGSNVFLRYSTSDVSPKIVITNAAGGLLTVTFAAADVPVAGVYRWLLDVSKSPSPREVVMAGPLAVGDV